MGNAGSIAVANISPRDDAIIVPTKRMLQEAVEKFTLSRRIADVAVRTIRLRR